jgi:hypothetical protein
LAILGGCHGQGLLLRLPFAMRENLARKNNLPLCLQTKILSVRCQRAFAASAC